jgi:hypothetical protein
MISRINSLTAGAAAMTFHLGTQTPPPKSVYGDPSYPMDEPEAAPGWSAHACGRL